MGAARRPGGGDTPRVPPPSAPTPAPAPGAPSAPVGARRTASAPSTMRRCWSLMTTTGGARRASAAARARSRSRRASAAAAWRACRAARSSACAAGSAVGAPGCGACGSLRPALPDSKPCAELAARTRGRRLVAGRAPARPAPATARGSAAAARGAASARRRRAAARPRRRAGRPPPHSAPHARCPGKRQCHASPPCRPAGPPACADPRIAPAGAPGACTPAVLAGHALFLGGGWSDAACGAMVRACRPRAMRPRAPACGHSQAGSGCGRRGPPAPCVCAGRPCRAHGHVTQARAGRGRALAVKAPGAAGSAPVRKRGRGRLFCWHQSDSSIFGVFPAMKAPCAREPPRARRPARGRAAQRGRASGPTWGGGGGGAGAGAGAAAAGSASAPPPTSGAAAPASGCLLCRCSRKRCTCAPGRAARPGPGAAREAGGAAAARRGRPPCLLERAVAVRAGQLLVALVDDGGALAAAPASRPARARRAAVGRAPGEPRPAGTGRARRPAPHVYTCCAFFFSSLFFTPPIDALPGGHQRRAPLAITYEPVRLARTGSHFHDPRPTALGVSARTCFFCTCSQGTCKVIGAINLVSAASYAPVLRFAGRQQQAHYGRRRAPQRPLGPARPAGRGGGSFACTGRRHSARLQAAGRGAEQARDVHQRDRRRLGRRLPHGARPCPPGRICSARAGR